jgi:predicted 3-demethylubiquinone-9 3-methyltransferase (glyoxalase superfamily)
MSKPIYPCLWFDGQAKASADHYCSIFAASKITAENAMLVTFELNGTRFMALNGGPHYKFTPASSYVIECETQAEIDHYWDKLGEGGRYREANLFLYVVI